MEKGRRRGEEKGEGRGKEEGGKGGKGKKGDGGGRCSSSWMATSAQQHCLHHCFRACCDWQGAPLSCCSGAASSTAEPAVQPRCHCKGCHCWPTRRCLGRGSDSRGGAIMVLVGGAGGGHICHLFSCHPVRGRGEKAGHHLLRLGKWHPYTCLYFSFQKSKAKESYLLSLPGQSEGSSSEKQNTGGNDVQTL